MSGELLPSIGAITTSCGKSPAAYDVPGAKVPSPLLRYTRMLPGEPFTATATSALPSPFRSPAAMAFRNDAAGSVLSGPWSVPSPFPSSADTIFVVLLAVATSRRPSLLRSATADHQGLEAAYGCAGWKVTAAVAPGANASVERIAASPAACRGAIVRPYSSLKG